MEINPNLTDKAHRDYRLVQLALHQGDQKAYADLMGFYKDAIYFLLLKMTNNPDDADDLTIEAFGKAFKKLDQYTPDYAFSTWLFKIASNNCIDHIRRKKVEILSINKTIDEEEGLDMSQTLPSSTPDPEEKMIERQKIKMMREVVEKLKPNYRRLVQLRYFDEYSYEEIAQEMDIPIGTVKAQLFRAREFLYNIMKNAEGSI
ncbi:MAG: sigma-70 family RNA polymerase sigma factor [Bacteroidales bacterium]|jgi:RNA polymerase sigma-70 factor (ECF subfamily)|nr:sigma-70 family RNA polymerase sigma factor [Bacteroidales bacterium]MDD4214629.1 sigma-70 family RNA polymerase sigma factor [Bacteroidales bacterium]